MTDNVSNGDIYDTLMDIKQDIGRMEGKVDSHGRWMEAHVKDDQLMAKDINELRLAGARQRGFVSAVAGVGSVIGAVIGYAASYFHKA